MSNDKTKVPSIPSTGSSSFDGSIKELLEVREGVRGNPLDRFVTLRDLQDAGLADVRFGTGTNGKPTATVILPGGTGAPNLSTPPPVKDFTVTGGYQQMFLSWQKPNMSNLGYVEVWRANPLPNGNSPLVASAELIARVAGANGYSDPCGSGKVYFYWVRAVSTTDVEGPFNSGNGTRGETAVDVEYLLDQLNGQITESQLWKDLGTRIDKIDDAGTLSETVQTRINKVWDDVQEGFTPVNVFNAYKTADEAFAEQVRGLVFVDDSDNRVSVLEGVIITQDNDRNNTAIKFSQVEVNVNANKAAITNEQTARANADSALTTSIDSALSRILGAEAAIVTEQTTRANADGALATSVTTLQTTLNGNTASIQTQATTINGLSAQYTVKLDVNGYVSGFGIASNSYTTPGGPNTTFTEFIIRADRFAIGSPGYAKATPFSVVTTSTPTMPAGVYMDAAYIKDGTITAAKIGTLSADKITAGLTNSVDIISGTFVGGNIYVGGSVTYEYGNGVGKPPTGVANVTNPNVAITEAGVDCLANYFRITNPQNRLSFSPFQVENNEVTLGITKLKTHIKSENFNGSFAGNGDIASKGTAGWAIDKGGQAVFNNINLRGSISGGSYTKFSDFNNSVSGFYTGPEGIALGNVPSGNYFVAYANGDVYTPGMISAGGNTTFYGTLNTGAISVGINGVTLRDSTNNVPLKATVILADSGSLVNDGVAGVYIPAVDLYASNYGNIDHAIRVSDSNQPGVPLGRPVTIVVTATAIVDHYFSIWYQQTGGPETCLADTYTETGGYDSISLSGVFSVWARNNDTIYFGLRATDRNRNPINPSEIKIKNWSIAVTATNF